MTLAKKAADALNCRIGMMQCHTKRGAATWEYLMVIAIVCIIGAGLINVITGSNGIASLWSTLYDRFKTLIETT